MELRALNDDNFELFESIFTPGGSGCFCAVWRTFDGTWEQRCKDSSQPNRQIAKKLVDSGLHWGFLAFNEGGFVGWTASGPKTDFPLLKTKLGSRTTPFHSSIWSIGCIAFKEQNNREVISIEIIQAVAQMARTAKAEFLEAYPTDPWDKPRSYRGSIDQYIQLGFERFSSEADGNSKIACMRFKL